MGIALKSTQELLVDFLKTSEPTLLVEHLQNLIQNEGLNPVTEKLQRLLLETNNWNFEGVQNITKEIISQTNDPQFTTILKLFQNKLLLLILDQLFEKTTDQQVKIETFLSRDALLDEAYQLSLALDDKLLVNSLLSQFLDNLLALALFYLHSGSIKNMLQYFGKFFELIIKNPNISQPKHSFCVRILSNLLLKTPTPPTLIHFANELLKASPSINDPFQIAISLLKQAISIDETAHDISSLALDYYNLSLVYYEQREFKQAIQTIKQANNLHEEIEDTAGIINDIILLGSIVSESDQKNTALEIFNQALEIAVEKELRYQIAQINLFKGTILREKKDHEGSLKHLKTALAIFKQEEMGSPQDIIDSTSSISHLLWEIGRLDSAGGYLSKLIQVEKRSGPNSVLMALYAQLAMTHLQSSNQAAFDENYSEFFSLSQKLNEPLQYANLEFQIGIAFCNLNRFQVGLKHLHKSLMVYIKQKMSDPIKPLLDAFSLSYQKIGKPEVAEYISDPVKGLFERAQYILEHGDISDVKPSITVPSPAPEPLPASSPPPIATPKLSKPSVSKPEPEVPPPKVTPPPSSFNLPIATVVEDKSGPRMPPPPIPEIQPETTLPETQTDLDNPNSKIKAAQLIEEPPSPPPHISIAPTPPKIKPLPKIEENLQKKLPKFIGRQCPQCNFLITDPAFSFCPQCATKLQETRQCTECGFLIENPEFKFCPKCAHPL